MHSTMRHNMQGKQPDGRGLCSVVAFLRLWLRIYSLVIDFIDFFLNLSQNKDFFFMISGQCVIQAPSIQSRYCIIHRILSYRPMCQLSTDGIQPGI